MALRNQPYIPLYVQDFMTDERLAECSASANGVLIRIMCLMHKSEVYGSILLKQKYKQSDKQTENFAFMLQKHLPYDLLTITQALDELTLEGVLKLDDDFLIQKRMVVDNAISCKRASAGKSGGMNTQVKNKRFSSNYAKAKKQANPENEVELENKIEIETNDEKQNFGKFENLLNGKQIVTALCRIWYNKNISYSKDQELDFKAAEEILQFMVRQHSITDINADRGQIEKTFEQVCKYPKYQTVLIRE